VSVVAVIPVKQFPMGKGRLSGALTDEARAALGKALAARTARIAGEAGMVPLIVAGDDEVGDWAEQQSLAMVADPDEGLNGAAGAGVGWCRDRSLDWIVLHADLPLLRRSDLESLVAAMGPDGSVIAPSSDGGTSALGARSTTVTFSYGPGSFHRHLAKVPDAVVLARSGLLHDLDTPADLESARRHRDCAWIDEIIG
jgi:2-phospho-L-lactate guanylyltransferase